MARDGGGTYSKPAGTTAVTATTIESAKFNEVIDDLAADLNVDRPIVAGGTGASTAAAALTNLGGIGAATTDTLTNKTIDSASNTLTMDLSEGTVTGTLAEFNTALSDENFASLTGSETLTGKTIAFASNTLTGVAPLASPALTGTPTVPTASAGTATTQAASTAFVDANFAAETGRDTIFLRPADFFAATGTPLRGLYTTTSSRYWDSWALDKTTPEHIASIIKCPWGADVATQLRARIYWCHPTTTTNFGVEWRISFVPCADGDDMDAAVSQWGFTDTGGAIDTMYEAYNILTISGTFTAGDAVMVNLFRNAGGGADNLDVDAYFLGAEIQFKRLTLDDT